MVRGLSQFQPKPRVNAVVRNGKSLLQKCNQYNVKPIKLYFNWISLWNLDCYKYLQGFGNSRQGFAELHF